MEAAATEPVAVWRQPVRGGYPEPWILNRAGIDRLRSFGDGTVPPPPLFHLTGARPTSFGDGTADAEMPASGWLQNPAGLIGGGTLAILADIAFGCAVETRLGAATPYTTAELSLTFLRPTRPGTTLTAHGQAIHVGRTVGLSEAFVLDPKDDTLVAHGTSRLSIFAPIDGVPAEPGDPETAEPPIHATPDPYLVPAPETTLADEVWAELGGREILDRQIDGTLPLPPIHYLTGIAPTRGGDGEATFTMPASEWLNSPARRLQGGTIALLADIAMIAAVHTTTPAGTAIAGLDLKINFLRPVLGDGRDMTAVAEVEHAGRSLAITRCRVTNADGKPVALATGSAIYLSGRRPDLSPTVDE